MKISYSAPAKVIISGEHAVVYGKPALASALDVRLTFTITASKKTHTDTVISSIEAIVKKYLSKKNIVFKDTPFEYAITSQIPVGRGLGSSAALSVASVAVLWELYTGKECETETINNLAYAVEKKFHQNPSGIDNTASCFGGLVYFRKEFEFLKSISLLNSKIPKKIADKLYLIDSGQPIETTKEMVMRVGSFYTSNPKKVEKLLIDIEKQTKRIVVALMKEDAQLFKDSLVSNQLYLSKLGIVSKTTRQLLDEIRPWAVGKVTGAGGVKKGSGYLLVLAHEQKQLEAYLSSKKIQFYTFRPSNLGVRKENA